MRIRRALLILTVVGSAGLSGCGGGDDDSSAEGATESASGTATADPPGEACDLLSAEEVSAAVGAQVKEGTRTSGPTTSGGEFSSCAYVSDDPDHPADAATVTVYPNPDAADQGRGDDAQPIEGLGDRAYASSFGSVWVYVDDISFFAQWYAFDGTDEENLPKSEALARAVVDELG